VTLRLTMAVGNLNRRTEMNKVAVLARKGDTDEWRFIENIYTVIKGLEDGCTTQDIADVMEPPVELARVSSVVSKLVLAENAPVTSVRVGKRHTQLRVIAPLPDALYDNPARKRRTYHSASSSPEQTLAGVLLTMTRAELLQLKLKVNALLATKI
jgi:hypothetical protein